MPIRTTVFAPGEHYHICIRGNNKQAIFKNDADRLRFLFLMTHLQSPEAIPQVGRAIADYKATRTWDADLVTRVVENRYVSLEAFAFMTNHVHIALEEIDEQGTARYMQRILNAYAKYVNTKYQTIGHVFQGPYRAVHIEDNDQLLYLSSYIHRNPRELPRMAGREHEYEWSSYQDYLGANRFGSLLIPDLVLGQFDNRRSYRAFVDSSIAKEESYPFDPF